MPYFEEGDLRDLPQMTDTVKYTTARVLKARGWIESVIEQKCKTSFVLRSHTEIYDGTVANVVLRQRFPRVITALTQNGVAFTPTELGQLSINNGVVQRYATGTYDYNLDWTYGYRNLSVTYLAGYSEAPPADIFEAAITAARDWLIRRYGTQGVSDRAMSMSTEMGNTVFSTANDLFRPTGIPDVDATIMGWAKRLNVPNVA